MENPPNDFEHDFIAQVKGELLTNTTPLPAAPPEKKPINRKLLIIFILTGTLIITAIILLIISSSTPTSKISPKILNHWICEDGTEIILKADSSYIWLYPSDAHMIETGTFIQKGALLTLTPSSLKINDQPQNPERQQASFELSRSDNQLYLSSQSDSTSYLCTGVGNE